MSETYTVTKSSPVLVPPATTTPSVTLPLSSIDRGSVASVYVDFISVFSHGDRPAARIKDAFAKALVHYYPVAGRIVERESGEPVVACTGEGIWYIDAKTNCSLADVKYLEMPLLIPQEEILPRPPSDINLEDQILLAQITEFTCGGFTVGVCFSHLVFDGQGAAQFLKAVGETARGLSELTVKPIWSRESIPNPPKVAFGGPPPSLTCFNFVTLLVEISDESISKAKEKFRSETSQVCTSFDVVTAMILKSRAKAINLPLNADVRLGFSASTRHLLSTTLPSVEGYYGNCIHLTWVIRTRESILNASLTNTITFIKSAKESLSIEFNNRLNGLETHSNVPLDYGTVAVADWRWVGFNKVDYGWGEPRYVFQVNDDYNLIRFGIGIYLKPPVLERGIRLMLKCVEAEHAAEFVDELKRV